MMACEICSIIMNPSEEEVALRVTEGDYWYVTLRIDQEYLGTVFITAKRHVESLPELNDAEEREFIAIRNQVISAQTKSFGAQVVNVSCLMNLAFTPGGEGMPHVHYHLKPRYVKTVERFGYVFVDRQFGAYIKDKHPNVVSMRVAKEIVGELRQHL